MDAFRRPLVKAAVAGGLLIGFWFLPSGKATADVEHRSDHAASAPARPAAEPGEDGLAGVPRGGLALLGVATLLAAAQPALYHLGRRPRGRGPAPARS